MICCEVLGTQHHSDDLTQGGLESLNLIMFKGSEAEIV